VLTEIFLCHACSCQEIEDGNAPGQARVNAVGLASGGLQRHPDGTVVARGGPDGRGEPSYAQVLSMYKLRVRSYLVFSCWCYWCYSRCCWCCWDPPPLLPFPRMYVVRDHGLWRRRPARAGGAGRGGGGSSARQAAGRAQGSCPARCDRQGNGSTALCWRARSGEQNSYARAPWY
jgi:hypothetical protein